MSAPPPFGLGWPRATPVPGVGSGCGSLPTLRCPRGPHPHPVPEAEGKSMALWPGRAWRASLQLRRWGDPQLWTRVLAHGCHLVMNTSSSSGWTRGSLFSLCFSAVCHVDFSPFVSWLRCLCQNSGGRTDVAVFPDCPVPLICLSLLCHCRLRAAAL